MQKAIIAESDRLEIISRNFLFFAIFFFIAILSFTKIYNGDIWWSLAEGREIVSSGVLQNTNKFAFTFPDHLWISAQWLFSLTAYFIINLIGISGLVIVKIIIFLIIVFFLFRVIQSTGLPSYQLVLFLLLFILAVHFRIMIRAHLFSILFFSIFIFLIHQFRNDKKHALYWLLFVSLLWSNFHSGIIFGLGFLALSFLEDSIRFLLKSNFSFRRLVQAKFFRNYIIFGIGSLLVSFINPQGSSWLIHAFTHLNVESLIQLVEYQPAINLLPTTLPLFLLIFVWLIISIVRIFRSKQLQPYDFAALVFLYFALKHNRIVPYFSIVAIISSAISLKSIKLSLDKNIHFFENPNSQYSLINLVLGLLLILAPLYLIGRLPFLPPVTDFGTGVNQYRLPIKSVDFLKVNHINGNGFNSFFWGGYLTWQLYPDKQVFIDGRVPAYPAGFIQTTRKIRINSQIFQAVDDTYNFQYLIFPNDYLFWDIKTTFLSSDWRPVYWDRSGARIYVKNNQQNLGYLLKHEYKYYNPNFDYATFTAIKTDLYKRQQLIVEIKRHYAVTGEKYDLQQLAQFEINSEPERK